VEVSFKEGGEGGVVGEREKGQWGLEEEMRQAHPNPLTKRLSKHNN